MNIYIYINNKLCNGIYHSLMESNQPVIVRWFGNFIYYRGISNLLELSYATLLYVRSFTEGTCCVKSCNHVKQGDAFCVFVQAYQ